MEAIRLIHLDYQLTFKCKLVYEQLKKKDLVYTRFLGQKRRKLW